MANPQKGEVSLKADGKDYTVSFSINAMCELEDDLGIGIVEAASAMSDPSKVSIGLIRSMFHASLSDHHPELTAKDAGNIMQAVGIGEVGNAITRAVTLAFPQDAPAEVGRPLPKARRA